MFCCWSLAGTCTAISESQASVRWLSSAILAASWPMLAACTASAVSHVPVFPRMSEGVSVAIGAGAFAGVAGVGVSDVLSLIAVRTTTVASKPSAMNQAGWILPFMVTGSGVAAMGSGTGIAIAPQCLQNLNESGMGIPHCLQSAFMV